ncbi:circadian clock KaiB family protein [Legionella bononiensis]|nr:circadian clock KaiB family protein [Legionella bononiensis]
MNKKITKISMSSKEKPSIVPYKNWRLILYIAGKTPHCMLTFTNLKNFCDQYLPAQYTIEIIDLLIYPERAQSDDIIAIPTIVKLLPTPKRYIIGDFSNHELMLMKLGLNASTEM